MRTLLQASTCFLLLSCKEAPACTTHLDPKLGFQELAHLINNFPETPAKRKNFKEITISAPPKDQHYLRGLSHYRYNAFILTVSGKHIIAAGLEKDGLKGLCIFKKEISKLNPTELAYLLQTNKIKYLKSELTKGEIAIILGGGRKPMITFGFSQNKLGLAFVSYPKH